MSGNDIIRVPCAHCGHIGKTLRQHVGRSGKCKKCGRSFVISADYLQACEVCKERMALDATVCPHCGHSLGQATATPLEDEIGTYPRRNSTSGRLSLTLSLIAVALAAVSLGLFLSAHPPGSSLRHYDFTTPHNAALSRLRIALEQDDRAAQELFHLLGSDELREKLSTFQIHEEAVYGDHRVLFISYDEKGVRKYEIDSYKKDARSGFWLPSYLNVYKMDDAELRAHIESWEESGVF